MNENATGNNLGCNTSCDTSCSKVREIRAVSRRVHAYYASSESVASQG